MNREACFGENARCLRTGKIFAIAGGRRVIVIRRERDRGFGGGGLFGGLFGGGSFGD